MAEIKVDIGKVKNSAKEIHNIATRIQSNLEKTDSYMSKAKSAYVSDSFSMYQKRYESYRNDALMCKDDIEAYAKFLSDAMLIEEQVESAIVDAAQTVSSTLGHSGNGHSNGSGMHA